MKRSQIPSSHKKTFDLVLVLLIAYFILKIAYIAADHRSGYFTGLDPDNVFVWNYIHHIVQRVS